MKQPEEMTANEYRKLKVRKTKYHNKRCEYNGMKFDSKKELQRYQELELLQRAGEIMDLQRQVPFKLPGGIKYIADFTYREYFYVNYIVEDSKGVKTKVYRLKKKLIKAIYNIEIRET